MGVFQTNQFPYTDLQNLNIDWLLHTVKDNIEKLKNLQEQVDGYLNAANEYTDQKFAELVTQVDNTLDEFKAQLDTQYAQFTEQIDATLQVLTSDFEKLRNDMADQITGVNARTDIAIEQNNEYIFERIGQELIDVKVINYFTGEKITIQEMFDYLAQFHLTNAIDYETLERRNNTYDDLIALNITYTQLATDGGALIPQK